MIYSLKISRRKVNCYAHYLVILIAGLSTILRPSIESDITLFRVVLPFLFIWLLVFNQKQTLKFTFLSISFLIYSLIVSYTSRFHWFSIIFNLYYITVFFFYFYSNEVIRVCTTKNVFKFLSLIYKVLLILALIQYYFGGVYLNTQDRSPAINIMFWNENEFSSILAVFTPLFFLQERGIKKYFWIICALFLMVYNDAKLAILSMIVFFAGFFILKFKIFKIRIIGALIISFLILMTLFTLRNYHIQGDITINSLLTDLATHIYELDPLIHIGTFNARSNAIILGTKELLNSYFFGIGPGNSLGMMEEIVIPGTEKWTALSMHNFTFQIITEMGFFGLGIVFMFYWKVRDSAIKSEYSTNLVFIFYLSCLISITLLSGAWSNYFYLFILFYSIHFFRDSVSENFDYEDK